MGGEINGVNRQGGRGPMEKEKKRRVEKFLSKRKGANSKEKMN